MMFFTQVFVPVVIIAVVSFYIGTQWERDKREAEMRKPLISQIQIRKERKH